MSKGFEGKELTDMDALYEAGVRGFTDDGIPLMDEKLVEEAMKKAKELDVPISLHEEDPAYIKPGKSLRTVKLWWSFLPGRSRDGKERL